jgi:hypothetical protein
MHTKPMKDSDGVFSKWKKTKYTNCKVCNSTNVYYKEWDSSCGGYTDYYYRCNECANVWWVDGPDS